MATDELPYAGSPFVIFSDFDGTITTEDSNDFMTDNLGFGKEERRRLNVEIYHNRVSFRDGFRSMLESVNEHHTFEQCKQAVKENIILDPGFREFFEWSKDAKVPVVIVSSGMRPIIRSIFENLIGPTDAASLDIISNDVNIKPDGHFNLVFRHPDSHFGHDKSKALRPYRELPNGKRPITFFCGDGVSDLSAAGESDVLFVKVIPDGTNDLAHHCQDKCLPFIPFTSFTTVRDIVKDVVEGRMTLKDIEAGEVNVPQDVRDAVSKRN